MPRQRFAGAFSSSRASFPRRLVLATLVLGACNSTLKKAGEAAGGGDAGPGGSGISIGDAAAPASDGVVPVAPGAGEQCVGELVKADVAPLDLVFVLDASGSMRLLVGAKSRWTWVTEAMEKFVADPRSAGVGVGLDVFPFIYKAKPCMNEDDCGGATGTSNVLCAQLHLCVAPGTDLESTASCDPSDPFCPAGATCEPAGVCSRSGGRCVGLGTACPGGMAGDVCAKSGMVCKTPVFSCAAADYEKPLVPIGTLPATAPTFTQQLGSVKPAGDTPLLAGYLGALHHLTQYLAAHPDHRGALVLATDGAPSGCAGGNVPDVVAQVAAAQKGTPAVPTYAIGVMETFDTSLGQAFEQIAAAGGTGKPFAVTTSADFGDKFLGALNEIRGKALPCDFDIPAPPAGAIDFGKVNVRTTVQAQATDLRYVQSAAGCDAKGGWYYDADPNGAATPKRVQLCPASCDPLKADPGGRVELRFGCRTRID
jgi:hypothetical protein